MHKDVLYAFRMLRRSPMFTVVAVASLALGIGANTAIFSLLNQVVLRSLPVKEPGRLVLLHTNYLPPGDGLSDNQETVFSNPLYRQLRDHNGAVAAMFARSSVRVVMDFGGKTEPVTAELASGNFFLALGVRAAMGRVLLPEDDKAAGGSPVVVLGHRFWANRLGRAADVLNQKMLINQQPMVVVGIAPPGFNGVMPGTTPDLYIPIAMQRAAMPTLNVLDDPRTRWLNIFARLKPRMTVAQAQSGTNVAYAAALKSQLAGFGDMGSEQTKREYLGDRVELRPAAQGINGLRRQWEQPLKALMAMVAVVLLIACANVAGLVLARAGSRQREIAIRLAMGAKRSNIIRQLLMEGLLLAVAGGALGLLVASWSTDALIRLLPGSRAGNWLNSSIDGRLLAFTAALSMAAGIAFALLPALQVSKPEIAGVLKNQAASTTGTGGAARFRRVLVSGQVALSLLLLVGAGLFSTTLVRLTKVDLGFRTNKLLMFLMDATTRRHDLTGAIAFYDDLIKRLSASGDVQAVAAADGGPFSGSASASNLTIEGYQPKDEREMVGASRVGVNAGFFRAMGVPLRAGRDFSERDDAAAPKVVVVNEAFVRRFFAGRDPIGRKLMFGAGDHAPDREIVGVAADVRSAVREPANETVYFPYRQWWGRPQPMTFYVRGTTDAGRLAGTVREVAQSLDAGIPVLNVRAAEAQIADSIYEDRLIAMLSVAFSLLATLLAATGLYGVVAYSVARRTPEIGVRIAMGAVPRDVIGMVLADAARTAGVGIAAGLFGALVLSRLVETQLFGVKAYDPLVFGGAALVLAVVTLAAAMVPGRRAARIDPLAALKYE